MWAWTSTPSWSTGACWRTRSFRFLIEYIIIEHRLLFHAIILVHLRLRTMDYWEFSINFVDDNPHGNDKRRTSQQGFSIACCFWFGCFFFNVCLSQTCTNTSNAFWFYCVTAHLGGDSVGIAAINSNQKASIWLRSRILLGTLGPVPRAKISDLVHVDPDAPMAPNHRAQSPVWLFSLHSTHQCYYASYMITQLALLRCSSEESKEQLQFCSNAYRGSKFLTDATSTCLMWHPTDLQSGLGLFGIVSCIISRTLILQWRSSHTRATSLMWTRWSLSRRKCWDEQWRTTWLCNMLW